MVAQTRTKARKGKSRAAASVAPQKASDALTIPQLKQAFDYIEDFASGAPDVEDFIREWRRVFHRPIEREHASAYLDFVAREARKARNSSRTLRVHRGGAEAAPGVYAGQGLIPGAVTPEGLRPYGAFPSYVASGFEVSIPIPAQGTACAAGVAGLGPQDAVPVAAAVQGGARGRAAGREKRTLRRHRGGRIPFSTAPPSALQNMATLFRGQPQPPSASPIENPYL